MGFNSKIVTVNNKRYGKLKVELSRKCQFGNIYIVHAIVNEKLISGVIDVNGNELIPMCRMMLTGIQSFNNGKDLLMEFKHSKYKNPEYFHIRNYEDETSKILFKTDYKSEIPFSIGRLEDTDDYWVIEMGSIIKKYAIYDYKDNKMISTFFDEIQYLDDNNIHTFYYSMALETEVELPDGSKEPHIHSSLMGFLDGKGNLSSQIYDIESNMLYSSYMYGPNTLSPKFNELVHNATKGYEKLYYEKEDHIDEVLAYLAENYNMSEKPKDFKEGEKILKFNSRKKM